MLELEEALRRILSTIEPLPPESVALNAAASRVAAEAIRSPLDLPCFDNSAMDGYAVRSSDLASARHDAPVALKLSGRIAAGETSPQPVQPGTCVRVFTGSPLPSGADAVVMQEDTRSDPKEPDRVWILDGVKPWENVRLCGEDIKAGAPLLESGERVTPRRLGLLASTGVARLQVRRQPVIGLLATGSELIEAGEPLTPGKIYESNRLALAPLISRSGASPCILPLVADTLEATGKSLASAFAKCDGVITSGGVSVGELDFVKAAFEQLGGSLDLWKVAIKPGKPFVFGRWGAKYLFGLPGNPVSAMVTFLLLVRPALWRWQERSDFNAPATQCVLAEPLANHGDRRHFMRVRIDESGKVASAGPQASHMLGSLASADGMVDVPANTTLEAGTLVRVILFDD